MCSKVKRERIFIVKFARRWGVKYYFLSQMYRERNNKKHAILFNTATHLEISPSSN